MNNTAPISYFEEARIEFFKHAGLMDNWLKKDGELIPVVADIQCDLFSKNLLDDNAGPFSIQLIFTVKTKSPKKSKRNF
ncbi:hypothetical protein GJU41_20225 [Bacillus idriensis]|uniref:Uncharacterized protein n=1 Tax=Metabacillus idriensis TaxID=324768 RepID=A0A6I2MGN5_9BACI|nr:hypothetical protein [Metabacillus idriensis]MRX56292.1 hypothetical protein [Metabacillus idriensis]